jgi:hypothetical protein
MPKSKRTLLLLAACLLTASAQPPAKPAPKPLFRDPVYDGAADPTLIWNPADKLWYMFYTNRRASEHDLTGVTWVHGTRIGIATSPDGVAWKYTGTVRVDYGQPDYTHWAPEIFAYKGIFHMYLSVVPGILRDWNAPRQMVHLTSKDLHEWKFESVLDLGSDRVIDACVIQLPDGTFRMWYKNERAKDGSLYYADSPDLYDWTAKGNAIPGVSGEGPKAFRWKGQYWLIADVWKGFAVFHSQDCLRWERQPDNILSEPGTQPTDRAQGNHADIEVSGDRAFIFYFAHQRGQDAEGKDAQWSRRSVIQVAELKESGGVITCDRNQPLVFSLQPPVARQP